MTERYEKTVDDIMNELVKIGFSNIADYLKRTPDGRLTNQIDFSNCTPDQMAAVESIQTDEVVIAASGNDEASGEAEASAKVVKTKFKMHDKKGALVDLLRQRGGLYEKDKPATTEPQTIVVEGGLPAGDTMPLDIKAAAEARKAKRKAKGKP